jgi:4-aminobutyrate aminotransferase/(S)-3-amino-2-methylpropionate transaminase
MTTNAELHERRLAAVPRGWGSTSPTYVERAENAELWDVEGRRYIDFGAGIAVLNTGHLHPKVKAAVADQLDRFSHTCFMVNPYEVAVELAERLNALVPGPTPKKTMFVNSGAEAVENAVKIARAATGRPGIIAFSGGFHGRTMMALALTGKIAPYKLGFGPFPADVYHAPFPYEYRGVSVADSLAALDELFHTDIEPSRVAAIVLEPVLGEGGFVVAPPEFLQALRARCDEHGILLVIDEVQTGFARTGRMFASEHAGVEADIVTMAKSLAGGFPLAAVTGRATVMDAPGPSGVGGTYGASPLACVAALAVLDVIEEEGLVERAAVLGDRIRQRLHAFAAADTRIGDVRGLGAMVAFELVTDPATKEPDAIRTAALVAAAVERGLILLSCGTGKNVIRILAPLTIPEALLDEGLDILETALAATA